MGSQKKSLSGADVQFIENQKLFYIASSSGKEVNLSPKGYDCLRVLNVDTLLFMSYPGSANRTHTDAANDGEFTIVFNSFEKEAKILRIFCKAKIIDSTMSEFNTYLELFGEKKQFVRDFFEFSIYAVETSCGESVPFMDYKGERPSLKNWVVKMAEDNKLEKYKEDHFLPPDLQNI